MKAAFFRVVAACVAGACFPASPALAQGGPPLVTDDPGTPGDGHWEINLAALGSHATQRWDVDMLDADINYGLGDHLQLKLDAPWTYVSASGQGGRSGLGAVNTGVKWRFLDEEDAGFSLSSYPQYLSAWSSSSKRRGIASPDAEFFLPVEFSKTVAGFEIAAEIGRNFVQHETDQWETGVVVAHSCGGQIECLVEVHETIVPHDSETLLNFGLHWTLGERTILLAAAGREFGAASPDRQSFVFYAGVQLLR